jgi:hypothetical protein
MYIAESSASLLCVLAVCACVWAPCSPDTIKFNDTSIVPRFAALFKVFRHADGPLAKSREARFDMLSRLVVVFSLAIRRRYVSDGYAVFPHRRV